MALRSGHITLRDMGYFQTRPLSNKPDFGALLCRLVLTLSFVVDIYEDRATLLSPQSSLITDNLSPNINIAILC